MGMIMEVLWGRACRLPDLHFYRYRVQPGLCISLIDAGRDKTMGRLAATQHHFTAIQSGPKGVETHY